MRLRTENSQLVLPKGAAVLRCQRSRKQQTIYMTCTHCQPLTAAGSENADRCLRATGVIENFPRCRVPLRFVAGREAYLFSKGHQSTVSGSLLQLRL